MTWRPNGQILWHYMRWVIAKLDCHSLFIEKLPPAPHLSRTVSFQVFVGRCNAQREGYDIRYAIVQPVRRKRQVNIPKQNDGHYYPPPGSGTHRNEQELSFPKAEFDPERASIPGRTRRDCADRGDWNKLNELARRLPGHANDGAGSEDVRKWRLPWPQYAWDGMGQRLA